MDSPRILITQGDPAGIGPEVILKSLADPAIRALGQYLILGHQAVFSETAKTLGMDPCWEVVPAPCFAESPTLYEPCPCEPWTPGQWSDAGGRMSLACVRTAIDLCQQEKADGVVTGPICKAAWKAAGADWPGHTELFADSTRTDDFVMMLAGGGLQVALVTIHEPLDRVPQLISVDRIVRTARVVARDLRRSFGIEKPTIAILGLNPHAGEEGHMGGEEAETIAPAVKALQQEGMDAIGPLPADTAFHHALQGEYDAVIAMYHDQGLGPLKTVAFDSGVNVTLGLPIVRTSVDHGTAFNIAGTGKASPESCSNAIRMAVDMVLSRRTDRA